MEVKRTDGKLECEPIYASSVIQHERGTIARCRSCLVHKWHWIDRETAFCWTICVVYSTALSDNDEAINDTVWARMYKGLMTLYALVVRVSIGAHVRRKRKYRLVLYFYRRLPSSQTNGNKLISRDFMQVSRTLNTITILPRETLWY